jgi:hypothetical protein
MGMAAMTVFDPLWADRRAHHFDGHETVGPVLR